MHKTANIVAITTGLIIGMLPVLANAKSVTPPFSGVYVGIDTGAAWASSNYKTDSGCPPDGVNAVFCNASPAASSVNGTAVQNSGTGSFNLTRLNYDVHVGRNWNINNFVLGGEAEAGGVNISDSMTTTALFPSPFLGTSYTVRDSVSAHWLGTLRARTGFVVRDQFLLYATGGLAFTDMKVTSIYNDNAIDDTFPGGTGDAANSSFRTGWVIGAGGEWQVSEAYTIKLEYLFVKFASMNLAVPLSNTEDYTQTMNFNANLQTQILRVGFNYNFA